MLNPKVFPYMCFVRFDLIVKEFDAQFNVYFDDHIRELAERVGYGPAWRTSELRVGPHAATGDLWSYLVENGHASLGLTGSPVSELTIELDLDDPQIAGVEADDLSAALSTCASAAIVKTPISA